MNYKVVIDAGHGGSDFGNTGNGLIEKDYALLISNYIKNRLDDLGIENIVTRNVDRELSIDERISIMQAAYGLDEDVIVVSNHLNSGGDSGLEVIYSIRDRDNFSRQIADQVSSTGGVVNKYYQLRDPDETQYDFFELLRETPNYETVMIEYGYVDNLNDVNYIKNDYKKYAEAVVRAIAIYTGNKYVPLHGDQYYVVVAGDSLWKIATKFGISVEKLKSANNLTSNNLSIGQLLFIPSSEDVDDEVGVTYIVKAGDSLWKIATSYGIGVEELKSYNNLISNILSVGQELKIPSNSFSDSLYDIYVVVAGDNLYKIANKFGVTVNDIKNVNNLTSGLLSIGQSLKIPSSDTYIYAVVAGDTLYKIANKFGVSVEQIKSVNNLTNNLLSIGQKLKI